MTAPRFSYDGVVIAAPVTIPYVRYSTRMRTGFLARALPSFRARSGLNKDHLDGLGVSSFTLFPDTAVGLTQHLGLSPRWLDHLPYGRRERRDRAATRRARGASRRCRISSPASRATPTTSNSFRHNLANFVALRARRGLSARLRRTECQFRAADLALYAQSTGAGRPTSASSASRSATMRCSFRIALFKKPLTLEEYLNARPIADPLKLFDCVMPCAGAEGFLVMREEHAQQLGLPFARILGTIERHNAFPDDPIQFRGGWALDRDRSLCAGRLSARPTSICSRLYDDYPVINCMQLEDLGFCREGRRRRTSCGATASPSTARCRSTPPADNFRSGRPARPAAFLGLVASAAAGHRPGARRAGRERAASLWSAASA